jgi:hypothetical protein
MQAAGYTLAESGIDKCETESPLQVMHHHDAGFLLVQVFTKLLLTSLPHELGKFILDSSAAAAAAAAAGSSSCSSSGSSKPPGPAGVWLAGEVSLAGPPIACLSANLTRTSGDVPRGKADIRDFVKVGLSSSAVLRLRCFGLVPLGVRHVVGGVIDLKV